MKKANNSNYLSLMQRNIKLAYVRWFFQHFLFIIPIWYAFETGFASPAVIGAITASASLAIVIMELPTGALADLIGRKKTIFLGLIIISASWLIVSQSQNASWLWIGYLVGAVGRALNSGADIAIDFDSLKELGKEKTYAKFQSNIGLVVRAAIVISTLLGGYIFILNMRLPYVLTGLFTIISAVTVIWLVEPKIDTEKFTLKNYIRQTKLGFKEIYKNSYIRDFSIYYVFVSAITWYFMIFLNMAYATEIGFSSTERSLLFAGMYFVAAIVSYFFVRSKLMTRNRVYLLFPLIIILGLIPAVFVGKSFAILLIFLVQLAGLSRFAILDQYANEEFKSRYRATAVSSLNMNVSLLTAILAFVGGKLIEQYGAPTTMSLLGIIALVTTVPTAAILLKNHTTKI